MGSVLIRDGRVIDPANGVDARLNLLLCGGRVVSVTTETTGADLVIDAAGQVVSPGFLDIHMHEDPVEDNGSLYRDPDRAIFPAMLRMGVTTAVAGQCGDNACDPGDYLDLIDREGAAVNVGMFAGHSYFRHAAGHGDKYTPAAGGELEVMRAAMARALERGCLGISYGIRYVPGADRRELEATAALCVPQKKPIAAHMRSDAAEVFASAEELLALGEKFGLPVQISHIGSMAGFGQMEEFLRMADRCRLSGLDVSCDCYPYYAFSTSIGSATYDDGWRERYSCGYDVVELCEGKYKGMRCTREMFEEVRREHPGCITVCHVMDEADVDLAFSHPRVMVGSDGVLHGGQGHPRAAGAFPRVLGKFVREGRLSLHDALAKMTALPAGKLGLASKGRLNVGADADVVVFDPGRISDRSTFEKPTRPPTGIGWVLLGGQVAAKDCRVVRGDLGRSVRR